MAMAIESTMRRATPLQFEVIHSDGPTRLGRLTTAHGIIETPNFMVVGTLGTPKGLTLQQIR